MIYGRIKCYFESRGYGFIEDNDGQEVYFHLTAVEDAGQIEIANGMSVYFDVMNTAMGIEAFRVRLS